MKTWTLRIRKEDRQIFERIRTGEKTVETRALSDPSAHKAYYGKIAPGDSVTFLCDSERITKKITAVRKYPDFEEYLKKEDLENICGVGTTIEAARKMHYGFPGYAERLKKYGIVAFEIE